MSYKTSSMPYKQEFEQRRTGVMIAKSPFCYLLKMGMNYDEKGDFIRITTTAMGQTAPLEVTD